MPAGAACPASSAPFHTAVCIPAGMALFSAGERYAKRNGKLKRSG